MNLEQLKQLALTNPEVKAEYEQLESEFKLIDQLITCLLYTSPSPRDRQKSRMPSSA